MFGLGGQELLLILFVVLLFFGPQKLPELMRGLGKGMKEFKRRKLTLKMNSIKLWRRLSPLKNL